MADSLLRGQSVSSDPEATEEPEGYAIAVETGRIVVRHTGALSLQTLEASRRALAEVLGRGRRIQVLQDLSRAGSSLTPGEIFELCASPTFTLPPGAALAAVLRPGQFSAEDMAFAETISMNRGVSLRVFTDFQAAAAWLSRE